MANRYGSGRYSGHDKKFNQYDTRFSEEDRGTNYDDYRANSNRRSFGADFEGDREDASENNGASRRWGRDYDSDAKTSRNYWNNSSYRDGGLRNDQGVTQQGMRGKGPKGWTRSDERIKEDVCEALYECDSVDASNIEVTVEQGCVCLRGSVEGRAEKREAEHEAEAVRGVTDVRNELQIKRKENVTNLNTARDDKPKGAAELS